MTLSDVDQPSTTLHAAQDGRKLLRNLAAGGASSVFKALLQLGMLPLMGRLLGPQEFGRYAMVLPVAAFFTVIADGGFGASLAKESAKDRGLWSAAFYATLIIGLVLVCAANVSGLALSVLAQDPKLFALTAALSTTFLFISISTLPAARLIQRKELVSLSAIDTIAATVGAIAALVSAWRGLGAMSLAMQSVATFGTRAIALNLLAFEKPGHPVAFRALMGHLDTGGVLVGARLVDMFCRILENLLFQHFFGDAALGAYAFANQVCRFLCEAVTNSVWSVTFAHALRVSGRALQGLILDLTRIAMLATFPAACIAAASAPDAIPLVLGSKWQLAGSYVQILVCSYAVMAAASIGSAAFLATSENRLFLGSSASLNICRVIAVGTGLILGSRQVVIAVALSHIVYIFVMIAGLHIQYNIKFRELYRIMFTPAIAGLAGASVCLFGLHFYGTSIFSISLILSFAALSSAATIVAIDPSLRRNNFKRPVLNELSISASDRPVARDHC